MQYRQHRKARKILSDIGDNSTNYLIIHYSCESFYDREDGHSPRITSIAIYNYSSAQTESFSIHKVAERKGVDFRNIENQYDELECTMLEDFFDFVEKNQNFNWIHWNMRDINYGFKAIEHRFSVLHNGKKPNALIVDSKKIDIARVLIQCYGTRYIEHPRMNKLISYNKISSKDFLSGSEEAIAFKNKEYIKLHQSTLRKVDIIANIITRAINNDLKVKSKWYEIYGVSAQGIVNYCKNTWWLQLIWSLVTFALGICATHYFNKIFNLP